MDYITVGRRRGRPSESDDPPVGHPHLRLVSHLGESQSLTHNSISRSPASSLLGSAARTSQWHQGRLWLITKHGIDAFLVIPFAKAIVAWAERKMLTALGIQVTEKVETRLQRANS